VSAQGAEALQKSVAAAEAKVSAAQAEVSSRSEALSAAHAKLCSAEEQAAVDTATIDGLRGELTEAKGKGGELAVLSARLAEVEVRLHKLNRDGVLSVVVAGC
jgi:two-component sensor histidine kinase